ncbi:hypothetical protein GGR28_000224 [Lewinella aquimaris]|uniref:DUF4382 domain-containing protein n=1 Tax=Neolewinella aquimaris TaxID=1835722 RepID=A0A840E0Z5_9BACT|nr:DUF4382 domain-containing protein [Neolewinella aquimaris]MBB4077623.1 hypothetical protein [Neolewinella aquimaris]
MTTFNLPKLFAPALFLFLLLPSCEKEESSTEAKGEFSMEITDAPIDDASVKAVFVTVTDVRLDGNSVEGFNQTTVELSSLTEGKTATLFTGQLDAKTYSSIDLVLEDGDVNGQPGCYLLNQDNEKVALEVANEGVIRIENSTTEVKQNSAVQAVVDFDLRKALIRTEGASESYRFAGESRLQSSVRMVRRDQSGTLSGTVTNSTSEDGTIVVYAYEKGTYSSQEAEGEENSRFLRAVSSTTVKASGDYTLAFLPSGTYELVAVSYKDTDSDGKIEMRGTFSASALAGVNLLGLSVNASSTTTADFTLTSLIR